MSEQYPDFDYIKTYNEYSALFCMYQISIIAAFLC